jgi:hypothetical protein
MGWHARTVVGGMAMGWYEVKLTFPYSRPCKSLGDAMILMLWKSEAL